MSRTGSEVHTAPRGTRAGNTEKDRHNGAGRHARGRVVVAKMPDLGTRTRVATAWLVATCVAGCAPTMHTVEPYRSDPVAARALEDRASQHCEARGGPQLPAPSKAFITDGCSLWIDRSWDDCCVEHDIEYWCGGSIADRRAADVELRRCFTGFLPGWFTWGTYAGVRIGGHPAFPVHYRWGFGRDSYLPWYDPGTGVAAGDRAGPGARGAPGPVRQTTRRRYGRWR